MNRCLILSFYLCISSLVVFAQEGKVSLQFVSFPKLPNAEPLELLIGNEKTLSIEAPTNNLSPIYEVSRMDEWVLGASSTNGNGKFVFNTYGKSSSLDSSNQVILVVRKGSSNSDGFQLIPMDSQYTAFGGGDYFFMNATEVDIAVEIGNVKFALKPRGRKMVAPEPSKVSENKRYLYVYLHFRKGEEAIPFYSSTWRLSNSARTMVFFYHDMHTQQLRTHTIRNYIR